MLLIIGHPWFLLYLATNCKPKNMLLNCPHCKLPVPGAEINIQENIAHCNECGKVFRISDAMKSTFNNEHKINLLLPEGLEVIPGLQLDIKLSWRKISPLKVYFLFGIAFTGMPLFATLMLSTSGNNPPFLIYCFLAFFCLIGSFFLFKAISLLLNTTYLSATAFELRSEHRPINFLGWKNEKIPRSEIIQLYVERYEVSRSNDRPNYAYNLLVMLKNGEAVKILSNLKKSETAFYLEHQIEKYLQLEDRPMDGEYLPGQRNPHMLLKAVEQLDKMPVFLQKLVKQQLDKRN